MRFARYLGTWFRVAWLGAWGAASCVAGIVGLILPPAAKYVLSDEWEGAVSDLMWQVPIGIGLTVLAARLFWAPYTIHKETESRADSARAELDALRADLKDERKAKAIVTLEERINESIATARKLGLPTYGPADAFTNLGSTYWLGVKAAIERCITLAPAAARARMEAARDELDDLWHRGGNRDAVIGQLYGLPEAMRAMMSPPDIESRGLVAGRAGVSILPLGPPPSTSGQ